MLRNTEPNVSKEVGSILLMRSISPFTQKVQLLQLNLNKNLVWTNKHKSMLCNLFVHPYPSRVKQRNKKDNLRRLNDHNIRFRVVSQIRTCTSVCLFRNYNLCHKAPQH